MPTSVGSSKKQESSRKTSTSASLTLLKPFIVWLTTTVKNSSREGNIRTPYLHPEKSVCSQEATVRTRHGTTDWFPIRKGVHQGLYCHPDYLIYMQSTSCKKQESSRNTSISALLTVPKPLSVWITINWKILKEMGIPDHLTCLLRNLYAGQEATVRTGHGITDWFK